MSLERVLEAEVVVCAGSGGVGKTSISAAIALAGAMRGRKSIVVTIDPAKRLADALGIEGLSNSPTRIPAHHFEAIGLEPLSLDAMMLDTKTTFDELILRYAKDAKRAKRILDNRFYQAISGALSGTNEYMAMEKLYELAMEGNYDLIVVDTPPTRNALDFLEAPKRMTSFLEGRLLRWFLLPAIGGGKGLLKIANFAAVQFLRVVKRIIGAQVLADTADFFANFEGMYEGFKERAQVVYELLRQPTTSFVVITSPTSASVDEALFFARTLNSYGLPFGGLIVNRVHPCFNTPQDLTTGDDLIDALLEVSKDLRTVADAEESILERLEGEIASHLWARIPYLTEEVASLGALRDIGVIVFGTL